MDVFFIERFLCLFWLAVQQVCFACIKYAYGDIVGTKATLRTEMARNVTLFSLIAVLSFMRDLFPGTSGALFAANGTDYYPWAVRIFLCAAMVLFDSLLVLYFWRIVRVYKKGAAARRTWPADALLVAFIFSAAAVYLYGSIGAAGRLGIPPEDYVRIGRFFVQVCNFSYIALESIGALLIASFLLGMRKRRGV